MAEGRKRRKHKKEPKGRLQQDAKRDWQRWRENCRRKALYKTREEAEARINNFNDRVVLSLTPMMAYRCDRHNGWHVGHSNK